MPNYGLRDVFDSDPERDELRDVFYHARDWDDELDDVSDSKPDCKEIHDVFYPDYRKKYWKKFFDEFYSKLACEKLRSVSNPKSDWEGLRDVSNPKPDLEGLRDSSDLVPDWKDPRNASDPEPDCEDPCDVSESAPDWDDWYKAFKIYFAIRSKVNFDDNCCLSLEDVYRAKSIVTTYAKAVEAYVETYAISKGGYLFVAVWNIAKEEVAKVEIVKIF